MTQRETWSAKQKVEREPEHDDRSPALAPLFDRVPEAGTRDVGEILDRFIEWVRDTGLELYSHQEDAIMEVMAGRHVVLCTPTGSGKSLVAMAVHFKAMCEGERSFYTCPVKALASEKFFDFCRILNFIQPEMLKTYIFLTLW